MEVSFRGPVLRPWGLLPVVQQAWSGRRLLPVSLDRLRLDYFSSDEGGNLNLIKTVPWLTASVLPWPTTMRTSHWRRGQERPRGCTPWRSYRAVQAWYRGVRAGRAIDGTPEVKAETARQVAQQELSLWLMLPVQKHCQQRSPRNRCRGRAPAL